MSKVVALDWFLEVDGVVLSDHVQSISANQERDEHDVTAMGSQVKEYAPGAADFGLDVTFFNDRDAGSVWDTLKSIFDDPDTAVIVKWRPDATAAVSATNQTRSMNAKLYGLPEGADYNTPEMLEVTFRNADPAGISYSSTLT